MDESTEPRRSGLRWSWSWAALALLGLVVVELVSRVEDRIAYGVPLMSRVTGPNDLIWVHSDGARGRPNARYRRWALNRLGFRGPEIAPAPASGTLRVVTLGASETFGLYETSGRDYPRQLEDSLRQRAASSCGVGSPATVEVVNGALPGMALPTLIRYIDKVVRGIRPDAVVLYPSPAFHLNARAPLLSIGRLGADSALPVRKALKLRTTERAFTQVKNLIPEPVMRWARRTITARRQKFSGGVYFPDVPADRLEQFERELRKTVGMARTLGAQVVLAGHVNATMAPGFNDAALVEAWVYQFPSATGHTLSAFHRLSRDIERRVAADSGVTYVDLPDAFAGHWEGSFADFVHFTDQGAGVVAGALAGAIMPGAACVEGQTP